MTGNLSEKSAFVMLRIGGMRSLLDVSAQNRRLPGSWINVRR